ncbi:MAG: type II toxin-antitoxin system Phd/YefM family antitoxin [Anaerovoracaceae bacterium]
MQIKSSTALRNDYNTLAKLAKQTAAPVFITRNGEDDTVLISIDAYEKREQMIKLFEKLMQAEREIAIGNYFTLEEVEKRIKEKLSKGEYNNEHNPNKI